MSPVVMPFVAFAVLGAKPSRRELAATALALAGLAILAFFDYRASAAHLRGDAVCFVAMALFTVYLTTSRRNNPGRRLWTYLVPLYLIGGLFCLIAALALGVDPIHGISAMDVAMTLALALGPTIMGHSIMNWAMFRFSPQTISLVNLGQFVFAGVLGFAFFGELPAPYFYATSALIVTGAVIAILPQRKG
jgi:drug/metabolite transporter (DMT)-like permease